MLTGPPPKFHGTRDILIPGTGGVLPIPSDEVFAHADSR
jgi:hypothetical protein